VLRRLHTLLTLPPEISALVSWGRERGRLSFSTAAEITRLGADRNELSAKALEHDLSREEVRAIIQRHLRGGVSLDKATQEIVGLRPIVERSFLFIGRLPGPMDDIEAQRILRMKLAVMIGAANVITVSCQDGRFSILLTEAGARHPKIQGGFTERNAAEFIGSLLKDRA
jgi:hypothetical protein